MSEVITTSWEEHPMYRIDHRDPGSVLASADRLAAGITGTIRSAAGIYQSMPPGNLPDLYWSRLINARECAAVLLDYLDRVVQESPHQPPRITAHREEPGYRETKRQEIVRTVARTRAGTRKVPIPGIDVGDPSCGCF